MVSESAFAPAREHGVHTAFVEQVAALRALGVDVRVNDPRAARRARLTVTHSPGPFAAACLATAGPGAVAVAHVTPDDLVGSLRLEPLWRPLGRRYLRAFYRRAARVVAVSASARAELLALGVEPERIRQIPNGIDTERIGRFADRERIARARAGGRPERPLVLGVGQIQPRKGIDAFVAVARALPGYDFAWVGGRPMGALSAGARALERIIAGAPTNFRRVGPLSREDLLAHYHAADAFLLASRHENFSQVVVEAAAAGLPLVLGELPAFREHYADGAVLVSDAELAGALRAVIDDRARRDEAVAGAGRIARRYSARQSAEALLALAPTGDGRG